MEDIENIEIEEKSLSDIAAGMYVLAQKLRGMAEIFGMAHGEPPFSEEALHGLAEIFMEFSKDLEEMRDVVQYDLSK